MATKKQDTSKVTTLRTSEFDFVTFGDTLHRTTLQCNAGRFILNIIDKELIDIHKNNFGSYLLKIGAIHFQKQYSFAIYILYHEYRPFTKQVITAWYFS